MSKNKILDRPRSEAAHRELSRFSRLPTPGLGYADVGEAVEVHCVASWYEMWRIKFDFILKHTLVSRQAYVDC